MRPNAAYWINNLQLTTHVEGGAYREVYRSPITIPKNNLSPAFHDSRNIATSIYFLLEAKQFSAFHRIASDEQWHFYFGDPLIIYEIDALSGELITTRLGTDPGKGEVFQTVVRGGNWFASRVAEGSEYALAGCTVSPGFDFADFELAERHKLILEYPQYASLIETLTR